MTHKELLISGYAKEAMITSKIVSIYPIEINQIISEYYLWFCDGWSKKYSNTRLEIDTSQSLITGGTGYDGAECTVYGRKVVEEGIHVWRIKIESITYTRSTQIYSPYIGIISDNESHLKKYKCLWNWNYGNVGYQFAGGNGRLTSDWYSTMSNWSDPKYKWREEGDVLEIKLDLDKHILSFQINENEHQILVINDIISGNYRLAMTLEDVSYAEFLLL